MDGCAEALGRLAGRAAREGVEAGAGLGTQSCAAGESPWSHTELGGAAAAGRAPHPVDAADGAGVHGLLRQRRAPRQGGSQVSRGSGAAGRQSPDASGAAQPSVCRRWTRGATRGAHARGGLARERRGSACGVACVCARTCNRASLSTSCTITRARPYSSSMANVLGHTAVQFLHPMHENSSTNTRSTG
jgi:hypothetical protein